MRNRIVCSIVTFGSKGSGNRLAYIRRQTASRDRGSETSEAWRMRFWLFNALEMSVADRWCAYIRFGSTSTCTCRTLPPYGNGMDAPSTVESLGRMNDVPRS